MNMLNRAGLGRHRYETASSISPFVLPPVVIHFNMFATAGVPYCSYAPEGDFCRSQEGYSVLHFQGWRQVELGHPCAALLHSIHSQRLRYLAYYIKFETHLHDA